MPTTTITPAQYHADHTPGAPRIHTAQNAINIDSRRDPETGRVTITVTTLNRHVLDYTTEWDPFFKTHVTRHARWRYEPATTIYRTGPGGRDLRTDGADDTPSTGGPAAEVDLSVSDLDSDDAWCAALLAILTDLNHPLVHGDPPVDESLADALARLPRIQLNSRPT